MTPEHGSCSLLLTGSFYDDFVVVFDFVVIVVGGYDMFVLFDVFSFIDVDNNVVIDADGNVGDV